MVRAHPRISIPGESHFIPHFFQSYGDPRDSDEAIRLGGRIVAFTRVRRWGLDIRAEDFSHCRRYADAVETLFRAWAGTESKPRWGDKTPHYVRHIPTLLRIHPNAQVLHIIRDPRPACDSWKRHPFGTGNHHSAALLWVRNVSLGREAGTQLRSDQYHEVRYEDLLGSPDATMNRIFGFLEEITPEEGPRLNPPPLTVINPLANVSRTELVASNADAWRGRMTPVEIRRVESVAGDLMERLGYEASSPPGPSPPIRSTFWRLQSFLLHYLRMFKRFGKVRDNFHLLLGRLRRPRLQVGVEQRDRAGR